MIDWSNAPEWAQYHAFDADCTGFFHEYKPKPHGPFWGQSPIHGEIAESGYELPVGVDWLTTLTERPDCNGPKADLEYDTIADDEEDFSDEEWEAELASDA